MKLKLLILLIFIPCFVFCQKSKNIYVDNIYGLDRNKKTVTFTPTDTVVIGSSKINPNDTILTKNNTNLLSFAADTSHTSYKLMTWTILDSIFHYLTMFDSAD